MLYRGQFTLRNDGEDYPAFIYILDTDSGTEVQDLVLASDPTILTYENAGLTDTIHSSQLAVNLIATADGQYRDIIESSYTVYCFILFNNKAIWYGLLASRTWSEPFSREKNYNVSLTFSDFGALKRIKYSPGIFEEDKPGAYRIDSLLSNICSRFMMMSASSIRFNFLGLDEIKVKSTSYRSQYVSTRNFVDDKGSGLSLYECLEKVLAPAGVHIVQRFGEVYVFIPNSKTYTSTSSSLRSSLAAAGIDAVLESCELYKDVTLTYNQASQSLIGEHRLDAETTGYEGKWDYVVDEEEGSYIIAGPPVDPSEVGSYANFIKGSSVTPCIWYIDHNALHDPGDVSNPNVDNGIYETPLAVTQCEAPICRDNSRTNYPRPETFLTVKVPVLFLYYPQGGQKIKDVCLRAQVKLTGHNGYSVRYYYASDSGYGANTDPTSVVELHYEDRGEEWGEDDVVWRNVVAKIPTTTLSGVLEVKVYPDSLQTDVGYGYIKIYALQGVRVEIPESVTDLQIVDKNVIKETFDSESDDFEKEFDMGTPILLSAGTFNGFMSSSFSPEVQDENTYLRRYMDFLRQNFSLKVIPRRRWHIRGSYRYDHSIKGLPVFDLSSQPLETIDDMYCAFMVTGEEWHLRSGKSILDIEEFYIGEDK